MGHLFVSYSRKDAIYAVKLVDALRREGFNVWIDMDLRQGTQWDRRIENQLKECDAYILIVTPNSHNSSWVRKELLFVQAVNKPVFPFVLEKTEPWLAILDMQHTPALPGGLPPRDFYDQLAKITTRNKRKERQGADKNEEPVLPIDSTRTGEQFAETTRRFMARVSRLAQDGAKSALEKTT